jgi:hypothetical protein
MELKRLFIPLIICLCTFLSAHGQLSIKPVVTASKPLEQFLIALEQEHSVKFFFQKEWITDYTVDKNLDGKNLKEILDEVLNDSGITYTVLFGYAVILIKDPSLDFKRADLLTSASSQRKTIRKLVIGNKRQGMRKQTVTLRGTVVSNLNASPVPNVVITASDLNRSTVADPQGMYELRLPPGGHVIEISQLNYDPYVLDLEIYKDSTFRIELADAPTVLQEVEVSDQAIVSRRVSQSTLNMRELKRSPTFLGERDVIKTIQIQPGVTTVGEVAAGFNVRGGGADQNLVLYDGVPVFNTSHALGFFTAFNAEAVGQVSFYRGGIPAEFGGRASSVLNISSRDGNVDKFSARGGIGIISSHVTLEGPIKRDTTSVIASIRSSYSNWLLNTVKSRHTNLENSSVSFYDASIKLTHNLSKDSKLTFSAYNSHDDFTLADDTVYNWNNIAASIKLDHAFNEKLFSTFTLGYGSYDYVMEENDEGNAFDLNYGVKYPFVKADFIHSGPHTFSFGLHNTYYSFQPGEIKPTSSSSSIRHITMTKENSVETGLYVSDAFYLNAKFFIEAGFRLSVFNRLGPGKEYLYQKGAPREERNVIDSIQYGNGEVIKTYFGPEPRLSLRYELSDDASIKIGYNRIYQYLHLITNTAAVTPVDIWQSSNTYFKPQRADQVSIGYYRNIKESLFEAFVETFYKHVNNVLDFKDGADLILNEQLETDLIQGKATSYGVEFSVNKTKGRLQGGVNYTFSRSFRTVNGTYNSEKINRGEQFKSNYDQPHVANLTWRYGFSRRHFFSGNFVYHTGRPMSVPLSYYVVDGIPIADFSERNKYRLPDYHRLDIAFIIEGNHKRKKILDGNWVISFYNVYARKNAYSAFYKPDDDGVLRSYKLSVIGTIIPSISYTFKI